MAVKNVWKWHTCSFLIFLFGSFSLCLCVLPCSSLPFSFMIFSLFLSELTLTEAGVPYMNDAIPPHPIQSSQTFT
ncbi:hypothetical protein V8F33_005627 [Rhypophila sp. PSN 637]